MAKSNFYAGVAGYVGRADQVGKVGVFSRAAGAESWTQPVSEHETYAVHVHPTVSELLPTLLGMLEPTPTARTRSRSATWCRRILTSMSAFGPALSRGVKC